ncbi:hypothetical protein HAX54_014112 [Datura stramonium]|uniref:Uncharacterized protein n=1 Tax=Datura stramonium TaxID=4076 RepID=A0ABS8RYP0_DATST|nr:hypothetical protein [Datura stramonium]
MFFPWTVDLAEELGIPRFSFQPCSFFTHCVWHRLEEHEPHKKVASDSDDQSFSIPGLPHEIRMKLSEIENYFIGDEFFKEDFKKQSKKLNSGAMASFITIVMKWNPNIPTYSVLEALTVGVPMITWLLDIGKIELAIKRLMFDSDENRNIRANAKLMAEKVKRAAGDGEFVSFRSQRLN